MGDAPSKIFDPILDVNNGALSASVHVLTYHSFSAGCFILGRVQPTCYAYGLVGVLAPEPEFDTSKPQIDNIIDLLQNGNVDNDGYKNALIEGIKRFKGLYDSNPNCFNDYSDALFID